MKKISLFTLLLFSFCGFSQIEFPPVSPYSKIIQQVGISELQITYSRPATKGRKIVGGLIPYGRIWRVGANESSKLKISTDIKVGGENLPKGTYALYAFPFESYWDIVFHRDTTLWGDGREKYNPDNDALRIRVHPLQTQAFHENFLISFDSITHNGAQMHWQWENTLVSIPIRVKTDEYIQKEIEKVLEEKPTAQTYYEAARYLVEQNRNPETALIYVDKAIEIGGETYYYFKVKSLAEAGLGQYDKAIKSAEISRSLADELGKDEFVRLNNQNIKKWEGAIDVKKD